VRIALYAIFFTIPLLLPLSARGIAAQNLPACRAQLMTRHGNEITIGLQQLSNVFNQQLRAAHSTFTDLRLSAEGGNKLKVSGKNNGTPVSISGPLQAVGNGALKLHADQIVQNGTPEKALMGLTGKNLADYAHFKNTDSLSTQGNNIFIHPDPLLNVSGRVTGVSLNGSTVTLRFASQPCR
jgi:hypothetical protein